HSSDVCVDHHTHPQHDALPISYTFPPARELKFRIISTMTTTSKKVPAAATSSAFTTTTIGPSTPPRARSSISPKTLQPLSSIANPTGPSNKSRLSASLVGPRMTPPSFFMTSLTCGRLLQTACAPYG